MTSLPCCSAGTNGIGGQGITLAIVDSSSGAASAARDEAGDRLRGGRQEEHPADDPGQLVEPVLEPGHDAEVAATAADRPEQVGLVSRRRRGRARRRAVTMSAASTLSIVRPWLADEVADPAAERDPADPDRARVAEPDREAVLADGRRQLGAP